MEAAEGQLGGKSDSGADERVIIRTLCFDYFFGRLIHWLDGVYQVRIRLDSTVEEFKILLSEMCNIPVDELDLVIYNSQPLDDDKTLASYGLKAGETVHVLREPVVCSSSSTSTPIDEVSTGPDVVPDRILDRRRVSYLVGAALVENHVMTTPQIIRNILRSSPISEEFSGLEARMANLISDPITIRMAFTVLESRREETGPNTATSSTTNTATGSTNVSGYNSVSALLLGDPKSVDDFINEWFPSS